MFRTTHSLSESRTTNCGLAEGLPSCAQASKTESEQFGVWGPVFEPLEVKGNFCALRKVSKELPWLRRWVDRGEEERLKTLESSRFSKLHHTDCLINVYIYISGFSFVLN